MADRNIQPSLLDRLVDDRPEATDEPAGSTRMNVEEFKGAVARDLENIFNTRREHLLDLPPGFANARKSLLTYGLPDIMSFNPRAPVELCRVLETAISNFEPRLQRLRVTVPDPGGNKNEKALHFRIEALLRTEPAAEPVAFDTVLRISTQEYHVTEGADGG